MRTESMIVRALARAFGAGRLRVAVVAVALALAACGADGADGGAAADSDIPAGGADVAAADANDAPGAPCLTTPVLRPGEGLALCSGAILLRAAAPADAVVRELGPLGAVFNIEGTGVTGLLSAPDGVVTQLTARRGFDGATTDGPRLGSDEAAVRAAWGEPAIDPFLGVWWYRNRGIGVEWADGKVDAFHVFAPTP